MSHAFEAVAGLRNDANPPKVTKVTLATVCAQTICRSGTRCGCQRASGSVAGRGRVGQGFMAGADEGVVEGGFDNAFG